MKITKKEAHKIASEWKEYMLEKNLIDLEKAYVVDVIKNQDSHIKFAILNDYDHDKLLKFAHELTFSIISKYTIKLMKKGYSSDESERIITKWLNNFIKERDKKYAESNREREEASRRIN